ncbi:LD-carboxypeptidase [Succinimonas amylolytica]|uniref:LD-carboxypeptidase n=1 Tax=Succinimonas amylolytica TaxID=83769 RepID=UPI00036D641A|nr:LD-carboxypeptidase [Succinimonas amylolytica]
MINTMTDYIAITGFSDAPHPEKLKLLAALKAVLEKNGFHVITGKTLSERIPQTPSPELKARDMAEILSYPNLKFIIDISGGDTANELLLHPENLIFPGRNTIFTGYSDLTVLLNAFFAAGGSSGVLYQALHALMDHSGLRLTELIDFLKNPDSRASLVTPEGRFRKHNRMQGIVIGGNLRCFLKLSGTPFMPNPDGKILVLESLGGGPERIISGFASLKILGITGRIAGIVLGTFTELQEKHPGIVVSDLLAPFIPGDLPVWETPEIGHYHNARGIMIGREYVFEGSHCFRI